MDQAVKRPPVEEGAFTEISSGSFHMPPEAALAMPVQDLARPPIHTIHKTGASQSPTRRRTAVLGTAGIATGILLYETLVAFSVQGLSVYEVAVAVLFAINFFWIALAAVNAVIGFAMQKSTTKKQSPSVGLKVALIIPAYNEHATHVFANACAMLESVNKVRSCHEYALFVLSDTNDLDLAAQEEAAFREARELLGGGAEIFYRRRSQNTDQKAGNIAEWCRQWGGAYDAMVVLDADSVMEGRTINLLADEMAADPDVGLLQTVPRLIKGETYFAKLQQFATAVYGPLLARGLAFWFANEGNYWGHNAIIRTRAFAACAGLPQLAGKGSLSGSIMSHDFVEAALLRRAGWQVRLLPDLGGSYEETPPSLVDHIARDQRWCRGNLQHTRIVSTAGLHPMSRFHLLHGVMSYLAAPLWLLFIGLGLFATMDPPASIFMVGQWPSIARELTLGTNLSPTAGLFATTMVILLLPKLLGLTNLWVNRALIEQWGGWSRVSVSMLIEVLLSAAIAPVLMIQQTRAVVRTLTGRAKGWQPQRRVAKNDTLRELARVHAIESFAGIGLVVGIASGVVSLWLTPVMVGLVFAAPLSALVSRHSSYLFERLGILSVPENTSVPPIVALAQAYLHRFEQDANESFVRLDTLENGADVGGDAIPIIFAPAAAGD
ncbi:MAG: glucans biosynthesis glucosyltransferase MdoH [Rhodobiaceae bacterium]|nr:MAG: glucans biosynthesis glucosyltransferase MdoH [Rhodobiaceae bacterium]